MFSDYPEKYLIPQLPELTLDYKLDGVWVDGECWGTKTVPQVGIFLSCGGNKEMRDIAFAGSRTNNSLNGLINLALEL